MTLILDLLNDERNFKSTIDKVIYVKWHGNQYPEMLASDRIPKYRVVEEVVDLARELGAECPLPEYGRPAWLEIMLSGIGVGILVGDQGTGVMIMVDTRTKTWYDCFFDMNTMAVKLTEPGRGKNQDMIMDRCEQILYYFRNCLALIQEPKIVATAPKVYDTKLQRARVKSGKRPLSDHTEVVIHVTRKEQEARRHAAEYERRTGVRLHRVRAHVKVQNGQLKKIAEYWRGSASLGVKHTDTYRVKL